MKRPSSSVLWRFSGSMALESTRAAEKAGEHEVAAILKLKRAPVDGPRTASCAAQMVQGMAHCVFSRPRDGGAGRKLDLSGSVYFFLTENAL